MDRKAIKLKYRSAERFAKDYELLKKGKIFLPSDTFLPLKTALMINFTVPEIGHEFTVEGIVIKTLDEQTANRHNTPVGMLLAVRDGAESILAELDAVLATHRKYSKLLGLATEDDTIAPSQETGITAAVTENDAALSPATSATADTVQDLSESVLDDLNEVAAQWDSDAELTLDWLRDAVMQEEMSTDPEPEPEITVEPTHEQKQLSLADRKKVKPSADFLMDLTKAMLRSGYYSADHPGSKGAKQGLYQKLQHCLGDSKEIMITRQETRQQIDILITGILEEPVNVRTLVGAGMADLFLPKLREYFKRKNLVSFAIKKEITLEHFESFVDMMSDPKADSSESTKTGELLSNALAERGITEISTVFMDDLIMLELNLPWRVEMAIQRLAKDLKMLPMFQSESDEKIRALKLQIIQDIIRPLKHPQFLKDLIINCYIIAKHVESIETEDIEQVIIEAFPLNTLLPTSQYIFEELNALRERHAEDSDNSALVKRVEGVKRILKSVVRRLILSDVKGAQHFLEQLYQNNVLTFEELPADVQYLVNTLKMAKDVQAHLPAYVYRIVNAETSEDAIVLMKLCRRILPTVIENNEWQIALLLTKAVDKASKNNPVFTQESSLSSNPQRFMYKDLTASLVSVYGTAEETDRKFIDEIAGSLGSQGIEVLSKVLTECDNRQARKSATEALIRQGQKAQQWVIKMLGNADNLPWYLLRNALMILRFVGKSEKGIDRARSLVSHAHPRVRDEALHTLLALKAGDAEQLVINALADSDDKVQWRAANALVELAPLSEASVARIIQMIQAEIPGENEAADAHARKVCNIIRSLGGVVTIDNIQAVEAAILNIAQAINGQRKGLLRRLKKPSSSPQTAILSAAIATLGKIGTPQSTAFLKKLAGSKTAQAEAARRAMRSIHSRYSRQQSDAPSTSQV
ncbi:MAG: HEAT repeat domain-containing protein [Desulfobacterales bacterium]